MTRCSLVGERHSVRTGARTRMIGFLLALALLPVFAVRVGAQGGVVAGRVMDASSRQPLTGVQIVVSGTQLGAVTDTAGRFRIEGLPGETVTLQARRVGYRPFTEAVRVGRTDLQFLLDESHQILSEVVVTGTATPVERRAIGNAVSSIDAGRVQDIAPSADVSNLLNGRAAGVVVTPGSGAVGSGPRIRIRGAASLSLTDQPLLYIDGVRVANDVSTGPRSQFFNSGVISRMNDIDPESVESIEIIKGPAAATLYGTEASNGVIQIITKQGRIGKPIVNASVRQGVNWFMDAEERVGDDLQPRSRQAPSARGTRSRRRTRAARRYFRTATRSRTTSASPAGRTSSGTTSAALTTTTRGSSPATISGASAPTRTSRCLPTEASM